MPPTPLKPGVIALIALFFLVFALVVMVGVPLLNASILGGRNAELGSLADWQITANITMIGMLVTGVFVITALRMEQTAKYTAFMEAKKTTDDFWAQCRTMFANQSKRFDGRFEKQAVWFTCQFKKQRDELASRFKEQSDSFTGLFETQLDDQRDQNNMVRSRLTEIIAAEGVGQFEELTHDQAVERIRQVAAKMLEDEAVKAAVLDALIQHLNKRPESGMVDLLVGEVVKRARWRWLFRKSVGDQRSTQNGPTT